MFHHLTVSIALIPISRIYIQWPERAPQATRYVRGQGAQHKMILHYREALRHAQGREFCRTAPACFCVSVGRAGGLHIEIQS
jgi:hypothetical protein